MKKFILASVALLAVFASCKKEDIRTVYETTPATVTINVQVFDAYLGQLGKDAVITASAGTVSGNVIKITGNKAVAAQTVNVTASISDDATDFARTGSVAIDVAALAEGGQANYSCKVIVGSPKQEMTGFSYEKTADPKKSEKFFGSLEKADHSYNDTLWVINNSEFVLYGTTTYVNKVGTGSQSVDCGLAKTSEELDYVLSTAALVCNDDPEYGKDKTYDYTVSAFARFNVFVTYTCNSIEYTCYRNFKLEDGKTTKEPIGVITNNDYTTSVVYKEGFAPDHASHYVAGHGVDDAHYSHGHGHGHGGENAGGGIIVAE